MPRPSLTAGKSSFNNGTIYRVASGDFVDPELGETQYGPIPDARKRLDFRAAKSAVKHAKKVANHYSADVMVVMYKLVNGHALHREHFDTISPKGRLKKTPPRIADCKWHLVSEDPPKDGTYLGYIPAGEGDKVWPVLFENDEWFNAEGSWRLDVTHWTPLPTEPKRGRGNCGGCGNTGCGCGRGGRANTVFKTYDEAFVEAAAMADRLGRKVELRRAQAFLPKGATRIPGANWLINLVGPHDAVKGQLVNPGEPLTAKQAAIRDGAGRGNQADLGFYGPGLRYLRPAGGRAARDPDDTAVGMLERYSTAKVARSMAFDHAMDYPRKSAQRVYWLNVVKAIEFRAALGTPLSTGGARRPTGPSLEAMDDVEADEYA